MSKKTKATDTKIGEKGNIKKTYALSVEERTKIQNMESVMGILAILRDGLRLGLTAQVELVKQRVGVNENNGPEGFERIIQMDPQKYELVVFDIKKVKDSEKSVEVEPKKLPN